MRLSKSHAPIIFAFIISFATLVVHAPPEALGAQSRAMPGVQGKGKMNWPKYFMKQCESRWKDKMSGMKLKRHCYYYKLPKSGSQPQNGSK